MFIFCVIVFIFRICLEAFPFYHCFCIITISKLGDTNDNDNNDTNDSDNDNDNNDPVAHMLTNMQTDIEPFPIIFDRMTHDIIIFYYY